MNAKTVLSVAFSLVSFLMISSKPASAGFFGEILNTVKQQGQEEVKKRVDETVNPKEPKMVCIKISEAQAAGIFKILSPVQRGTFQIMEPDPEGLYPLCWPTTEKAKPLF